VSRNQSGADGGQTSNRPGPEHSDQQNKDRILPFMGLAGIELAQWPDVRQASEGHIRNLRAAERPPRLVRMPIVIHQTMSRAHAVGNLIFKLGDSICRFSSACQISSVSADG